jgi:hypothetical protein
MSVWTRVNAVIDKLERRDNLIALINTWNEASAPYVMRSDAEHKVCNARAKMAMASIRRNYIEGVDYRELSNGALWPVAEVTK